MVNSHLGYRTFLSSLFRLPNSSRNVVHNRSKQKYIGYSYAKTNGAKGMATPILTASRKSSAQVFDVSSSKSLFATPNVHKTADRPPCSSGHLPAYTQPDNVRGQARRRARRQLWAGHPAGSRRRPVSPTGPGSRTHTASWPVTSALRATQMWKNARVTAMAWRG